MSLQIDAIYEHGLLRPLQPLLLGENQQVRLSVDALISPLSSETSALVDERLKDMQWLANEASPFRGQWVALQEGRLIAHGSKLALVSQAAKAAGFEEPLFARVSANEELPFTGW